MGKRAFIKREQDGEACAGGLRRHRPGGAHKGAAKLLANLSEVEISDDLIAFGRIDLDGDILLGEGFGRKIKEDSGTDEDAAAFVADVVGPAGGRSGIEEFVAVEDSDSEVAPKIRGARNERRMVLREGAGISGNHRAVRVGEADGDLDLDGFLQMTMIELSLLRAVVGGLLAGEKNGLSEGSEAGDEGNVRSGVGNRQLLGVLFESFAE